jgi:hypothetical protein
MKIMLGEFFNAYGKSPIGRHNEQTFVFFKMYFCVSPLPFQFFTAVTNVV